PSVDKLLGGGVRRRDLIMLGGDVGAGKSALALGIALRVAQQELPVALLSGEMDEERLMERALAIEGRVAVDELRAAKMNDQMQSSWPTYCGAWKPSRWSGRSRCSSPPSCPSSTPSATTPAPRWTTAATSAPSSSTPTWCWQFSGRRCTGRAAAWRERPSCS